MFEKLTEYTLSARIRTMSSSLVSLLNAVEASPERLSQTSDRRDGLYLGTECSDLPLPFVPCTISVCLPTLGRRVELLGTVPATILLAPGKFFQAVLLHKEPQHILGLPAPGKIFQAVNNTIHEARWVLRGLGPL